MDNEKAGTVEEEGDERGEDVPEVYTSGRGE